MRTQTKRIYGAVFAMILLAMVAAACIPAPAAPQPAAPVDNQVPVTAPTATTSSTVSGSTTGSSSTSGAHTSSSGAASSTGAMTWVIVPEKSSASYSVREQLAQRSLPSDAVGKTNAITGQVTIKPDGTIDQANSKFTVDASTLQTDAPMRDNFVRRNILQTNQFKDVVFVPTQVSGLPSPLPTSGSVSFKVTGNMTIRDQTKPVTWDVTGSINNGEATGTATTSFTFEDFGLNQPRVPVVLSLVDKINLSVTVDLKPVGN